MGGDEWPFLGRQAVRRGEISAYQLHQQYRPIYRNVYVAKDATLTALTRARAAWLWSGGNATLTGVSAAAVLGTKWLNADDPAELNRPDRHAAPGIIVHSYDLGSGEECIVNGIRITSPERTAFDIGRVLPWSSAVPVLDALANITNLKTGDVVTLADVKPGVRNVRRLRRTLPLVDGGAESAQERRARVRVSAEMLSRPSVIIERVRRKPRAAGRPI
ncbi:hypothetical protein [Candidatus Mycobacterium methanotrophicum]|uniref:Uncharacterized protein n=1 Tax=Candidatus Mycobacterium methanotrophicum TaxID=2943498 RepID=A0ABY4QNY9_9MYCO|nr:hypothetical protein [Candidatus Mycobacterium methanotrophicum]UQX11962.1 hypothetical protein M5I08_06255 [Candidatus Mycobacterium methanotrophicum]